MSRSTPVIIDGVKFDSKAEGRRYQELCLLEQADEIHHLKCHPRFELFNTFKNVAGKTVRGAHYTADFQYYEGMDCIVEDVKSPASRTQVYQLRVRLFQWTYPLIFFREVEA